MDIVLDNIIFSLQQAGGISAVWHNLVTGLEASGLEPRYIEYENVHENIWRRRAACDPGRIIPAGNFRKLLSQFEHPVVNSDTPFVFHSSYFRTCKSPAAINVTTVHDFTYSLLPATLKQRCRQWLNDKAILRSDAVVCVSHNTRRDLLRLLPQVDPVRVRVIRNGASPAYHRLGDRHADSPYSRHVLFVGGRQSYKNFQFAARAVACTSLSLLVVGAPLSNAERHMLDSLMPGRWQSMAYPDDACLNQIYNEAYCLAYPSSNEGFGIPMVEAARTGCPVIALNRSSVPEVLGHTELLLDRLDQTLFLEKLESLADSDLRARVAEAQAAATADFTIEKMVADYVTLYRELTAS